MFCNKTIILTAQVGPDLALVHKIPSVFYFSVKQEMLWTTLEEEEEEYQLWGKNKNNRKVLSEGPLE